MEIRIIYFNYIAGLNTHPSGALAKSTSYIRELKSLGFEVFVNWQSSYVKGAANADQLHVSRSRLRLFLSRFIHEPKKFLMNFVQLIRIIEKINQYKPDVIFERLENYYFAAALASKIKGLPLVVEADAPVVYEYKTFYGRKNLHIPFLPDIIELYTLKQADAVFCISETMKKYYVEKGINPDKITITPNGCNIKMFYPAERDRQIEEKFELKEKTVIGWVGSLFGWAGIENLIRLVKELSAEYCGISFLFVGGGQNKTCFENELKNEIESGIVNLPGSVPHEKINNYLSCMDIVLAPYPKSDFWYASSMKIFEYMGAGKAVVTSNMGQLKDIINHKNNGMLYEAGNFSDLKEKIKILIENEDLRLQIGKKACMDVIEKYTWQKLAERIAAQFESVVNLKSKADL